LRATIRDSQTLALIRLEDVQAYLVAHGWKNVRPSGEFASIYRRIVNDHKHDLLVPSTNDIDDYPQRMSDIIRVLESLENRSQIEIISDVASVRADVVRIRRPDAIDGTLRLEDGASLMRSAYDMVLAAACSAISPKAYFQGKRPARATDYIEKTRLGQTERGSFVLTVISPVPEKGNQPDLFAATPFERQVVRLIADGLHSTIQASEYALKRADISHFREATESGVSANLLDAVLGLMGVRHHSVDVNFAWSPEIQVSEDLQRIITIDPDYFGIIEEASKDLKLQEPLPPVELYGVVEGLKRGQATSVGHITLSTFLDNRLRNVQIDLDAEFYDQAIIAHRDKRLVSCAGELVRLGRTIILKNLTSFEVAPAFDPEKPGPLFTDSEE
jgi:hypothetical protein